MVKTIPIFTLNIAHDLNRGLFETAYFVNRFNGLATN